MSAYINSNYNNKALCLYEQTTKTDMTTHLLALKSRMNLNDFEYGSTIIQCIIVSKLNTMITFYGKAGNIHNALELFEMNKNNISTVNIIMKIYNENKMYKQCIELFKYMANNNNQLDNMLVNTVLQAAMDESVIYCIEKLNSMLINIIHY